MSELEDLKSKILQLKRENSYLKSLLKEAGISFDAISMERSSEMYDPDQGARINLKTTFTEEDVNKFFSRFWGRMDLFSQRTIVKSKGTANYYPQCYKIWKTGCPKNTNKKFPCGQCKSPAFIPLDKQQIFSHLKGLSKDAEDVIGIYPLFPDDTCRLLVYDFDNHEEGSDKYDFANTDDTWRDEVDALRKICEINEIDSLVERSRSGKGAHLWIFFEEKIDAGLARKFGNALLRKGAESVNLKSFRFYDRMLPMQDHMPKGGFGNLIALPLQGQALKKGNSAFVDENWNAYPDQWKILLSKKSLVRRTWKKDSGNGANMELLVLFQ